MDRFQDNHQTEETSDAESTARWGALNRFQRRIVGVLVEKSKTTPDVYPMTANSICNGANQKSNRKPKMDLDHDTVEDALLELRHRGAIIEVIGDGRVPKYKHALYEWLGVSKKELSVMTELLLRGGQTLGDLRARASRMDPIADQGELKEILKLLIAKNLVLELTKPGRGQIVSHNLYQPEELTKVRATAGADLAEHQSAAPILASSPTPPVIGHPVEELTRRIESLEEQVKLLQQEIEEIKS